MSDQPNSDLNNESKVTEYIKLDTQTESRVQNESPLLGSPKVLKSSNYNRRRERRPLSRVPRNSPLVGVVNSLILVIGLTLILLSRCENSNQNPSEDSNWLKHLITPKDLHLPPSVTDKLLQQGKKYNGNRNTTDPSNQNTRIQDKE